jgi:hypothetical protein
MTPVISPWVFYLMPVCENVSFICFFLTISALIAIAFLAVGCWVKMDYGDDDSTKRLWGVIKKMVPFVVIFALLACLIPNEETITKMIVAQNVTVERVEVVSDTVVTVYNDIMNLFRDSGAANG